MEIVQKKKKIVRWAQEEVDLPSLFLTEENTLLNDNETRIILPPPHLADVLHPQLL